MSKSLKIATKKVYIMKRILFGGTNISLADETTGNYYIIKKSYLLIYY